MERDTKTIAKHTAIYTVGTVLRNVATFLMLPIYTRYLTPADYGVIELLSMIIDLFGIVFGLRIGDAVFRYYAQYDQRRDKNQVISTAIAVVATLTVAGLGLIVMLADTLSLLVFADSGRAAQIALIAVTLPLVALTEVSFLYLRAEGRPWLFVGFGALRLVFQLSLNVYFVVFRQLHVDGVIYSAVIANALIAVFILGFTVHRTGFSVSRTKAAELARFSWPLILAALAVFYLTFADRYLLQIYTDTSQVGIYSLGYKFGFLLLLFAWGPFSAVWDAQRYSIAKKETAAREFNVIFTLISTALISFALCIGIFVRDLLMIISDPTFWAASGVAHIIVIAYVFQAWTAFTNLGILISGKTIHMAFATGIACGVMTLASLILIPRFGAAGAAVAVLVGFVVRFLWVYQVAKRYYDMQLEWGKILKIATLALAVYGTALLAPDDLATSLAIHVVEAATFFVLLVTLPILSSSERERIIGLVKHLRGPRAVVSGAD